MKKLIVAAILAVPLAAAAQVENYVIDPFHTVPYFDIDHLGFATMRGGSTAPPASSASTARRRRRASSWRFRPRPSTAATPTRASGRARATNI